MNPTTGYGLLLRLITWYTIQYSHKLSHVIAERQTCRWIKDFYPSRGLEVSESITDWWNIGEIFRESFGLGIRIIFGSGNRLLFSPYGCLRVVCEVLQLHISVKFFPTGFRPDMKTYIVTILTMKAVAYEGFCKAWTHHNRSRHHPNPPLKPQCAVWERKPSKMDF